MNIILDGNDDAMSCEDTDNLAGIIGEIKEYLNGLGKLITSVTLDGNPLTLDSIPDGLVEPFISLEICTEMGDEMPTKMMLEVQGSLGRLKQVMMDTANKIQQGSIEEAMVLFAAVCDGWDTIHHAIETLARFKGLDLDSVEVDGESGVSILAHPAEFLREMEEALTTKDYITVADILEFEIAPLFPRFEKLVSEIATRV